MTPEAIASLSNAIQPLVFETGLPEVPYRTLGTAFVVMFERRAFVLAARHSVGPQALSPVCLFPTDRSRRLMPLKDIFFLYEHEVPDDFADFVVIEIDVHELDSETSEATAIDLSLACNDWQGKRDRSELVVIGYPEDHSFVDYESELVSNRRYALSGRYVGPSDSPHLHVLKVNGNHGLTNFSGLSGSPVFAWAEVRPRHFEIAWCGMALKGTAGSGLIHFVDRSVLLDALKAKARQQ